MSINELKEKGFKYIVGVYATLRNRKILEFRAFKEKPTIKPFKGSLKIFTKNDFGINLTGIYEHGLMSEEDYELIISGSSYMKVKEI